MDFCTILFHYPQYNILLILLIGPQRGLRMGVIDCFKNKDDNNNNNKTEQIEDQLEIFIKTTISDGGID